MLKAAVRLEPGGGAAVYLAWLRPGGLAGGDITPGARAEIEQLLDAREDAGDFGPGAPLVVAWGERPETGAAGGVLFANCAPENAKDYFIGALEAAARHTVVYPDDPAAPGPPG